MCKIIDSESINSPVSKNYELGTRVNTKYKKNPNKKKIYIWAILGWDFGACDNIYMSLCLYVHVGVRIGLRAVSATRKGMC